MSKINFSFIQAMYMKTLKNDESYLEMLKEVLIEYIGFDYIEFEFSEDEYYIDHASSAEEGENLEMFKDKHTLANFLFDDKSYIQCDNDNY